jgi:hypothetical protein
MANTPTTSNRKWKLPKWKLPLNQAWAAVIAAVILTGGGYVTARATEARPDNTPAPTPSAKPTALTVPLEFIIPATVPYCNTFSGPGSIPNGDSLLLFDSATMANGQPLPKPNYYFDGAVKGPTTTSWSFFPVTIGPQQNGAGFKAALDGILVTNQMANFIESIVIINPPGNPGSPDVPTGTVWGSNQLPPGIVHIHSYLTRNSDGAQCAN